MPTAACPVLFSFVFLYNHFTDNQTAARRPVPRAGSCSRSDATTSTLIGSVPGRRVLIHRRRRPLRRPQEYAHQSSALSCRRCGAYACHTLPLVAPARLWRRPVFRWRYPWQPGRWPSFFRRYECGGVWQARSCGRHSSRRHDSGIKWRKKRERDSRPHAKVFVCAPFDGDGQWVWTTVTRPICLAVCGAICLRDWPFSSSFFFSRRCAREAHSGACGLQPRWCREQPKAKERKRPLASFVCVFFFGFLGESNKRGDSRTDRRSSHPAARLRGQRGR